MRKKSVESEKRKLKISVETVRLLSISVVDLKNVVGGIGPQSKEPGCR